MEPILVLVGVAIVAIVAISLVRMYNGLVQRRLRTDETWAQVDVQLKRRRDLVPNLVAAVSDYMAFEQDVLSRVTEARSGAIAAASQGPVASAAAEGALTGALRSLFAVAENYPVLKANQNVAALQEQLATTENAVGAARDAYNAAIRDYNTSLATFPAVVMARSMGFIPRPFFEAEAAAAAVPAVELR